MIEFKLKNAFIELDNLLKVLDLVSGGFEAKKLILEGAVKVDGVVETRVRRKLKVGDRVYVGNQDIKVV